MLKLKSEFNWYILVLGGLILYKTVANWDASQADYLLTKIEVELKRDISHVKGRRGDVEFRLSSVEHNVGFNILRGSLPNRSYEEPKQLKKGDIVYLSIKESDLGVLYESGGEVTIHGLEFQGKTLMTTEEFKVKRTFYRLKYTVLGLFAAFICLMTSVFQIPRKVTYSLVGLFIVSMIVMKYFKILVYPSNL